MTDTQTDGLCERITRRKAGAFNIQVGLRLGCEVSKALTLSTTFKEASKNCHQGKIIL